MKKIFLLTTLVVNTMFSSISAQAFWTTVTDPYPYSGYGTVAMIAAKNDNIIAGINGTMIAYTATNGVQWASATITGDGRTIAGIRKFIMAGNGDIYATTGSYILKSTDNCVNWSTNYSFNERVFDIAINPNNGDMFVLTRKEDYTYATFLYKSIDNGNTWNVINTTFSYPIVPTSIAIASDNTIYMGTTWFQDKGQVYKSIDNGITFSSVTGSLLSTVGVSIIKIHNNDIYVGTEGKGLWRSSDKGANWVDVTPALIEDAWVNDIVISSSGTVFVSVDYEGVYQSLDKGNTWTNISEGLKTHAPTSTVRTPECMAITSDGYLYAGTNDFGTYRSASKISTTDYKEIHSDKTTFKLFPNPTSDVIYIEGLTDIVPTVKLYNLQGKELIQTTDKQIDLSTFGKGVYMLQIDGQMVKVVKK